MATFLKPIDNKTWKLVVTGQTLLQAAKNGRINPKLEIKWTKIEDEESFRNSHALNAIFNGIDKNIFWLINTCVFAKEAWDILVVAHKGTSKVNMSRLRLLTSKFESLKCFTMKQSLSLMLAYLILLMNRFL